MSHTIELPDPLFREITGYAVRVAVSPTHVIQRAWEEFQQRHSQTAVPPAEPTADQAALITMVRALHGSVALPAELDDDTLITEARMEKYGPL